MELLPVELVQAILLRVDCSLPEYLRLSLVCRQWRSIVIDPSLLDRFFARRFSRHLPLQLEERLFLDEQTPPYYPNERAIPRGLISATTMRLHNYNHYTQSIAPWPPTLLTSSFALSCWLWLPRHTYSLTFDIQASDAERAYLFLSPSRNLWCVYAHGVQFSGQCQVDAEMWVLLVVNCQNSSVCSLWLNDNRHQSESERTQFHNLSRRNDTFVVRCYNNWATYRDAMIADLHVFPFYLTQHEIQAMIEQRTSVSRISMGIYISQKMLTSTERDDASIPSVLPTK